MRWDPHDPSMSIEAIAFIIPTAVILRSQNAVIPSRASTYTVIQLPVFSALERDADYEMGGLPHVEPSDTAVIIILLGSLSLQYIAIDHQLYFFYLDA